MDFVAIAAAAIISVSGKDMEKEEVGKKRGGEEEEERKPKESVSSSTETYHPGE